MSARVDSDELGGFHWLHPPNFDPAQGHRRISAKNFEINPTRLADR